MGEQATPSVTMTDEQRRLVRDNVGLVAVHLRRNVVNLHPKWEREWDELFQEGCLGLIRAAIAYRAERGIPFAAFALPRIHNAVSRAIQTKFNTIYVPPKRPPHNEASSIGVRRDEEARGPKVFALSFDRMDRVGVCPDSPSPDLSPRRGRGVIGGSRTAYRQHPDAQPAHHPTVGERLREKYERAVKESAQTVSSRASTRGDRERLVRALVEERFLVPEESSRRPLRHIARDTRSSYGRVADCDRQLNEEIRRTLEADPEFHALQKLSKADPVGGQLSIDENLERRLAGITAAEFTRRFAAAKRDVRASMLQSLLELSPGDLEEIVQTRVATLPTDARERLLRGS
jgi:hypothetical protein